MVFMPQRLLQEKLWLKEAKATVDPKVARSIYFRRQGVLEEATGEPCWPERVFVLLTCVVAASLAVASAYYILADHNVVAFATLGVAAFGAIRLQTFLVQHL